MASYTDIVLDDYKRPIPEATVTLFSENGLVQIAQTQTDVSGRFLFAASDDVYTLQVGYGGVVERSTIVIGKPAQFRGEPGGVVPSPTFAELQARMAAGEAIKIACFGDSEIDGYGTSGYTKNPVGPGSIFDSPALGNIDHEGTAPNAWPAKLKANLREAFGNNNIQVWNAGYQSKMASDGWAIANYDAAVTNNPYYGRPDVCFVLFGTNDQTHNYTVSQFISQMRLLLKKIIGNGTLPILLSANPCRENTSLDGASGLAMFQQFDTAKRGLAVELGIPFFDTGGEISRWLEQNEDGYSWYQTQPDGVHLGDDGHAYWAGFLTSCLFPGTVCVQDSTPLNLLNYDPRTASLVSVAQPAYSTAPYPRLGANPTPDGLWTASQPVMTAWLWNEQPDCSLVYRTNVNDGVAVRANSPRIQAREFVRRSTYYDKPIDNSGLQFPAVYKGIERPSIVTRLKYGLNKVTLLAPSVVQTGFTFGYFQLWPKCRAGCKSTPLLYGDVPQSNALASTGSLYRDASGTTGITMQLSGESLDGSNVVCFGGDDRRSTLLLELQMDKGTGFFLLSGEGFVNSTVKRVGVQIYRKGDIVTPYYYSVDTGGVLNNDPLWGSAGGAWAYTGVAKLRIDLFRDPSTAAQRIIAYSDWKGSTVIFDASGGVTTDMIPVAGYFGDLVSNADQFGDQNGIIDVQKAIIQHS
jgi:lysophospholipase L1-like esterase